MPWLNVKSRLFIAVLFLGIYFSKWNECVFAGGNGSATSTGSIIVPVATQISCSSQAVTASPGTQTSTLTVNCTISGNPNNLNSTSNGFVYPGTITNNGKSLTVTPVSSVTSPDGSILSINGSYNSFSGTLKTGTGSIWKIQSSCQVPTTEITPAGTYTGIVTYNWSTL